MSGSGGNILPKVIPADDLYYSEVMKEYTIFSDEEIESMIINCRKAGLYEVEDMMLYIEEVAMDRVISLLVKQIDRGALSSAYDEKTRTLTLTPNKL